MCDCIKRISGEIKDKCQKDFKKPIQDVQCAGIVLSFASGKAVSTSTFILSLDGQKKKEEIKLAHSFCPFCGEKL